MPQVPNLEESYRKCRELADSHYENFPVAKMVPKKIRPHVAAIYAFARTADDIADTIAARIVQAMGFKQTFIREWGL